MRVSIDVYINIHTYIYIQGKDNPRTYQRGGAPQYDGAGAHQEDVGLEGGQLQLPEGVCCCFGFGVLWFVWACSFVGASGFGLLM